MEEGNLISLL